MLSDPALSAEELDGPGLMPARSSALEELMPAQPTASGPATRTGAHSPRWQKSMGVPSLACATWIVNGRQGP